MFIVFLFIVSIFLLRTFALTFVSSICLYFKDDFITAALKALSGNSDIRLILRLEYNDCLNFIELVRFLFICIYQVTFGLTSGHSNYYFARLWVQLKSHREHLFLFCFNWQSPWLDWHCTSILPFVVGESNISYVFKFLALLFGYIYIYTTSFLSILVLSILVDLCILAIVNNAAISIGGAYFFSNECFCILQINAQ